MPRTRSEITSLCFVIVGIVAVLVSGWLYIMRPAIKSLVPSHYVGTRGTVISLGKHEVRLPEDPRLGDKPISMQRVIISYKDREGNEYKSEGFVAAETVDVGQSVPVEYNPEHPGTAHHTVGGSFWLDVWKVLFIVGGLLLCLGLFESRDIIMEKLKELKKE